MDQFRFCDVFPDTPSDRARRQCPIHPVKRHILDRECVTGISSKGFIATLAGKHHGHPLTCQSSYEIQRDTGWPDDWFVFMPDQHGQGIKKILFADLYLMMQRMDVVCDDSGIWQFAVALLRISDG